MDVQKLEFTQGSTDIFNKALFRDVKKAYNVSYRIITIIVLLPCYRESTPI